tara:strand:- start:474 stop:632 length:159 start_codon:yes stop_codon:yes gene_type:complete
MSELREVAELAKRMFLNDGVSEGMAIEAASRELDVLLCDDLWDEVEELMFDF